MSDVPAAVALGEAAFGNAPEAVNLWIGDSRSVSSCHKDHYENLYVVVRGEKVFTLLPPSAAPFLHERPCTPAHYEWHPDASGERRLAAVPDAEPTAKVPWIPVAGRPRAAPPPLPPVQPPPLPEVSLALKGSVCKSVGSGVSACKASVWKPFM